MPSVRIHSATRTKAVEDKIIENAELVGGELILTRKDGTSIVVGPVGGSGGASAISHGQISGARTWTSKQGTIHTATLSGNTTITLDTARPSFDEIWLEITTPGGHNLSLTNATFPAGVPAWTTAGTHLVWFITTDGGANWRGYPQASPDTSGATIASAIANLRKQQYRVPTDAITSTIARNVGLANQAWLSGSGVEHYGLVWLDAGTVVSSITWFSGSTAVATPTNQWSALRNFNRELLVMSGDRTNEAWAAFTAKTFSFAAPYTVNESGWYYITIMVAAATVPTLLGVGATGMSVIMARPPAMGGRDPINLGLTTPASAPATGANLASTQNSLPYAEVA